MLDSGQGKCQLKKFMFNQFNKAPSACTHQSATTVIAPCGFNVEQCYCVIA